MTAEQSIRNIERTMDAVNAALRVAPKPDPRADLVDLFERYAERGPDDHLYVEVETAADLVVDNDWQQVTEITDEQVNAAGRVMYPGWDIWLDDDPQAFGERELMRTALEAAMGVQS